MGGGRVLVRLQRTIFGRLFSSRMSNSRKEQGVEELLRDDCVRRPELRGDRDRGSSVFQMEFSDPGPRQEELAREEVHLDLTPLSLAVIGDAIDADGHGL